MANEVGLRSIAFEVHDLDAAVNQAASAGYGLVGGIGEYEGAWRMAYVRGPAGIIVARLTGLGARTGGGCTTVEAHEVTENDARVRAFPRSVVALQS